MITIFQQLPNEILHIIFSYDDRIKYRNGKFINQISKTDKRYKLIMAIPKPQDLHFFGIDTDFVRIIHFSNKNIRLTVNNDEKGYILYTLWRSYPTLNNFRKSIKYKRY